MVAGTSSGPSFAPWAIPTATASASSTCMSSRTFGSRTTPIRRPVSAVTGLAATLPSILRQAAVRKSGSSTISSQDPLSSSASARAGGPAGSTTRRPRRCTTLPRATRSTATYTRPGSTVAPSASGATRSTWSTPFCSTTTTVPGRQSRASQGTACGVCWALVASSTQSTGRASSTSQITGAAIRRSSPSSASTTGPTGDRAQMTASAPACSAADAATVPTAPAPMTATSGTAASSCTPPRSRQKATCVPAGARTLPGY